jgi:rhodanese-related sulfurtransferase
MAVTLNGLIMDTTKPSEFSISPLELAALLQTNAAPLVIDVRKHEPFVSSEYTLPSALRRDPLQVELWAKELPESESVLVYCVYGHEVGMNTMTALRKRGINATFLQGGIEDWRTAGLPLKNKVAGQNTRWVTRARPKIDRIACPWLIRSFVDAQAEFLYVPTERVRQTAKEQNATAYDVNATVAETQFTHVGGLCSFDAFVRYFRLGQDAAVARLATIVRAADTDTLANSPEAAGLLAISLGMSRAHPDDHDMLAAMMPIYDALFAWCKDKEAGKAEQHNWTPA